MKPSSAVPEIELADEGILDSMRHVSGYLDISTDDFRTIHHLPRRHAVGRVFGSVAQFCLTGSVSPR